MPPLRQPGPLRRANSCVLEARTYHGRILRLLRLAQRLIYPTIQLVRTHADPSNTWAVTLDPAKRRTMWDSIITEWASLIFRWLHVVAAIGWIGSSFYFIHLDLSLKPGKRPARRRPWRGLAGPWRRLLPDHEIPGRARRNAGRTDLVQMGGLHDLAVRLCC